MRLDSTLKKVVPDISRPNISQHYFDALDEREMGKYFSDSRAFMAVPVSYYHFCPKTYNFLTKKLSQFLFIAVEDILVMYPLPPYKTKITHFFPEKIYSNLFITVQTSLFSSIKPQIYHISIFKLIYAYYSASYRFNYRAPFTVFVFFFASLPVLKLFISLKAPHRA
jgi:hypothetical protein